MNEPDRDGTGDIFRRQTLPGAPPGTLLADPDAPKPVMRVIAFSADDICEREITDVDEIAEIRRKWPVTWLNVDGLGDAEIIAKIGSVFVVHPLALEDILHVHQRAKVESYKDHLFIVARMATFERALHTEQVSMILGSNFVLTFQETVGDCLDPLRERIRKAQARIKLLKPDYLAYAIVDAVIDNYFPIIEHYGELLEELEDAAMAKPSEKTLSEIHSVKRDLRVIRRAIWPHRDALGSLMRDPSQFVTEETRLFFRDTLDHVTQIIDLVEIQRELGADLIDLYMSNVSNRMNEVMKILTMISTIFIPLSFVAGVYGMNFDTSMPLNMPELRWSFGYLACLLVMAAIATVLLFVFFRKGWITLPFIGNGARPEDEGGQ